MRWKCMAVALSLREPSKALAMRLTAVVCSVRIASYSGTMRPKAWATFSATPWWGQSWAAVSKAMGVRVSRLGADLERFVAISKILLILRRGPLAHRQLVSLGAAERSPARAACTRSEAKGRSVSVGRRREAILYREEFGPPFMRNFSWPYAWG